MKEIIKPKRIKLYAPAVSTIKERIEEEKSALKTISELENPF